MLLLATISFSLLVHAATTVGPLAPISIHSLQAYSTAKPCAAGCLVFNGIWVCGVHGGYHDLGKDLGCDCSPINACWCSAGLQSAATSYISSCVSASCSKFGNVDGDVKSMLDLYGGYCATANVEVSSKPTETNAIMTPPGVASSAKATARSSAASSPTATGSTSGSTTAPEIGEKEKEEEGLSKSDIIALATALGVGIPSLLIGALALWFQLRKRRAAVESPHIAINMTPSDSQTQFLPRPTPTPPINGYPNVYELGDRGGQQFPGSHQLR